MAPPNLGSLCGLMPDTDPSSDQLHRVVELSSGITDEPDSPAHPALTPSSSSEPDDAARSAKAVETVWGRRSDPKKSPADKLKEALSSKQAFQKCYLVRTLPSDITTTARLFHP